MSRPIKRFSAKCTFLAKDSVPENERCYAAEDDGDVSVAVRRYVCALEPRPSPLSIMTTHAIHASGNELCTFHCVCPTRITHHLGRVCECALAPYRFLARRYGKGVIGHFGDVNNEPEKVDLVNTLNVHTAPDCKPET